MQENDIRLLNLNIYDNDEEIQEIFSCLSLKIRRDIIKLINEFSYTTCNIAEKLNIPTSTAAFHVKALLKAGILTYNNNVKKKCNEKILQLNKYFFMINVGAKNTDNNVKLYKKSIEIPIGCFNNFSAQAPCGIIGKDIRFINQDMPSLFYSPDRIKAGIIWLKQGFLEYKIPLESLYWDNGEVVYNDRQNIIALTFQFELCSETQFYNQDYESDISLFINDIKVCTIFSKGDYGERLGTQNPDWLKYGNTQYGLLYSLDIRYDGVYLNEKRVSDISVEDINLYDNNLLTFRIEVEKDAKHIGGFNLFGKDFGDYPQDIILTITYQDTEKNL